MPKNKVTRQAISTPTPDEDDYVSLDEVDPDEASTDNASDVPLFANADRRSLRTIAYIKLYKMEGKGWGYKGQIPVHSTYETIGQQYGDGLYMIEACNRKHKVLDTHTDVRISLGLKSDDDSRQAMLPHMSAAPAELDRIERLSTLAATEARQLNAQYTELVTTQTQAALERERASMQQQMSIMQNANTQTMQLMQQGFQQMMTLMQTGHRMTIEQIQAVQERRPETETNPLAIAELMMRSMAMGREWAEGGEDEGDDTPPWMQVLTGGLNLLTQTAKSTKRAALPAPNPTPAPRPKRGLANMSPAQAEVVKEALELYGSVRSSGLTSQQALEKLRIAPSEPMSAPDGSEEADDFEPDDSEDDSDSESDDNESSDSEGVSEPN